MVLVCPRCRSRQHYCYEKHPLDTFCVIHKFPLEMFSSAPRLHPNPSRRSKSKTISLPSPSPKLVVLMMVIPQQYRTINVVKYIVGSTGVEGEGRKKKKMEK